MTETTTTTPAPEAYAELRRRYEAGATIRQLATAAGCSYTAMRHRLLKAGTRLRPRSRIPGRAVTREASRA